MQSKGEKQIESNVTGKINDIVEHKEKELNSRLIERLNIKIEGKKNELTDSIEIKINDLIEKNTFGCEEHLEGKLSEMKVDLSKEWKNIKNEFSGMQDELLQHMKVEDDKILSLRNELSEEWKNLKDELSGMQDELFQYMKIEDTLSSRIRDRKAQTILNHWLNAMYQLRDSSEKKSLSLLLKQHIEFIFSLEQLCSTAPETIVDGLFYLEGHADEVPRSDLLNLLGELKRQQRLNERDVFIPLRRLEIKLQDTGEDKLET
ncbi:MAG: hypothetical protein ACL93V_11950 [Candidatus Electrothrix sp. YB6]